MTYSFQEVNIYIFDVHSTPKAISNPACVQDPFAFLVNEDQYRAKHETGGPLTTMHLKVRPLTSRGLAHNHFWKRYKDIWFVNGKPDYWKLQLPFVCEPLEAMVKLKPGLPFQAEVRPVIFLSGLGWSSNLYIHLQGKISAQQLIDFQGLINSAKDAFLVNGKPAELSDVFKTFAAWIRKEIYLPKCDPIDSTAIPRYSVTSIVKFQGPLNPYKRDGQPQMSNADQAIMLSILRGRMLTLGDLVKQNADRTFSLSNSQSKPDFGLVDFDRSRGGTLIFMQQAALQDPNNKLRCHGSNVRLCYMTVFGLLHSYEGLELAAMADPKIMIFRSTLLTNLKQLGRVYSTNMFCQVLYSNHKKLQKL